jgi:hypothetical protein
MGQSFKSPEGQGCVNVVSMQLPPGEAVTSEGADNPGLRGGRSAILCSPTLTRQLVSHLSAALWYQCGQYSVSTFEGPLQHV